MEKEGIVSIWGGNFDSQEDLHEFLEEVYLEEEDEDEEIDDDEDGQSPFAKYIGAYFVDHDMIDSSFIGKPITAEDLDGFSYAESFLGQIHLDKFQGCNAVIMYFDFAYQSKVTNTPPLKFIGNYPFSK